MALIASLVAGCLLVLIGTVQAQPSASIVCYQEFDTLFDTVSVRINIVPQLGANFDRCVFLDVDMYQTQNMLVESPVCVERTIPAFGLPANGVQARLSQKEYSPLSGTTDCGIVQASQVGSAGRLIYVVQCSQRAGLNLVNDYILEFGCDLTTEVLQTRKVLAPLSIRPLPDVLVSRRYDVYFYVTRADSNRRTAVTSVTLGTGLRLVVCLDARNIDRFDTGGPHGVFLRNCMFSQTNEFQFSDPISTSMQFSDDQGCLRNDDISPVNMAGITGNYMMLYEAGLAPDTLSPNSDPNIPANCFVSSIFPAATKARKNIGNIQGTISCSLGICGRNSAECFSDNGLSRTCSNRKKRDTITFFGNTSIQDYARTSFTIITDTPETKEQDNCFDRTTFVALSSVLGVLLLVVLAVAIFLFCHLMKTKNGSQDGRSSSSSIGITNKGFY